MCLVSDQFNKGEKLIFKPAKEEVIFDSYNYFSCINHCWYVKVKFIVNENVEIVKDSDLQKER